MTPVASDESGWHEFDGAPPPSLLHAKPIRDADEVLVLTYTCDLSFVEDVCVRQARATGARVTVVYDADRIRGGTGMAGAPVRDYVPVPVVCRSGGVFHPKLVVIASATDAVVSIGSGNATTAGWHHNAEVWTHIRAAGPTAPALVGDLAAWLRRLPDQLWIDRLGRDRLHAVADLLTARPVQARTDEPVLLTNDLNTIVDQLPLPASPVDRLGIASPFFDPPATALSELIKRTRPAQVRLLLTRDVQCDPAALDRALSRVGTTSVTTPLGTRYHHGKVVEWSSGTNRAVVTGSANCTQAALLRAMTEAGGNCELALLQEVPQSMLDSVDSRDTALDAPELHVRDSDQDHRPVGPRLRVLAIRLLRTRVEVTVLVTAGTPPGHLVIDLADHPHTLPHTDAHGRLHTYALDGDFRHDGRTAPVRTDTGELIDDALVTDVDTALTRITHPSPLEQLPLRALIGDEQQMQALFDALDDLAAIRADSTTNRRSGESTADRRARQEERIRSAVGPALLHLALGRNTDLRLPPAEDGALTPDDPDQTDREDDGGPPATDQPSTPITGTPAATVTAAVDALERRRREHLQQRIVTLVERSGDWPLPAQLASYRVVLILIAAGLWQYPEDWTWTVCAGLYNLLCADADDAFAHEHAALATIGLVALRHGQLSCPSDPDMAATFEELRSELRTHQNWLRDAPDDLLDRYTAGLSGVTFGPRFTSSNVRADADWLLTRRPIDDAVDAIAETIGPVEHANDGTVTVRTTKDPRRTALLVLDKLRDFPDTHVIVRTHANTETHGWWNGRRLLLLTPAAPGWRAAVWPSLITGIASYATGRALPPPTRSVHVPTVDDAWGLLA